MKKLARFDVNDAKQASEEWGFNCGPGALCGMLGMTPDEIRRHMGDFESKGYTNPTLMYAILRELGIVNRTVYRSDEATPATINVIPSVANFAFCRVQWGGSWTRPGVPMMARYRQTHWIGYNADDETVFDVNAICVGGWVSLDEWRDQIVPWLCGEVVRGWDGSWWVTHAIEVTA